MPPLLAQAATDPPPAATDRLAFEAVTAWDRVVAFVTEHGTGLALNLLAAIVIVLVGRWATKLLTRLLERMLLRAKVDETLRRFLGNIAHAALLTFVVMAAIQRLGVDTTSFAAVVAAAGLAIGLALQGSLSNFASGVMLILFQPFRVGDAIDAGGTLGIVEEIQVFSTLLRTGDNVRIIVPNSQITAAKIVNYSAKETRRIDLVVACGYDDDLRGVKAFLTELLAADERILTDPAPVVAVDQLADSGVHLVVRPWVKKGDYDGVRWDLVERIKLGFDERGYTIPYPTRDLHVHGLTLPTEAKPQSESA